MLTALLCKEEMDPSDQLTSCSPVPTHVRRSSSVTAPGLSRKEAAGDGYLQAYRGTSSYTANVKKAQRANFLQRGKDLGQSSQRGRKASAMRTTEVLYGLFLTILEGTRQRSRTILAIRERRFSHSARLVHARLADEHPDKSVSLSKARLKPCSGMGE